MGGKKTFVAGDILTASQVNEFLMDQVVQVYASDAARGSAIPSAIEGAVSYLEDVNKLQVATGTATYVDVYPAVPLSGAVLQVVHASTSANTSGNTAIPLDNTIPQQTEGVEMLTASITPKSATSTLLIQSAMWFGETSNAANSPISALFRDSTASAIAATVAKAAGGTGALDNAAPALITYSVASGSTAATTFKVRCGMDVTATIVLNGMAINTPAYTSPLFNGTYRSTITIWEVQG